MTAIVCASGVDLVHDTVPADVDAAKVITAVRERSGWTRHIGQ
jgi:hypothetical protein